MCGPGHLMWPLFHCCWWSALQCFGGKMREIHCVCQYCTLAHTIKLLLLDTCANSAARPAKTSSGNTAGVFVNTQSPEVKAWTCHCTLRVASHTPSPDLTPANANSNTCASQGRKDHIVLNMQVGINLIPWVQSNVNGAIIMHMLPLRSPIKSKGYCYLALSIADVGMIDYWGCSFQRRTLFIPNLLAVCCRCFGEAVLHCK